MSEPSPLRVAQTWHGVAAGAQGLALAALAREHGDVLYIATHDRAMEQVAEQCRFFAGDIPLHVFPAWDCLPYDRASPHAAIVAERMATLATLTESASKAPRLILTTVAGVLQKLPPQEIMRSASLAVRQGSDIAQDVLIGFLAHHGYRRAEKVMEPGEFARRGDIIDIFPAGGSDGIRLDFFGNTVEKMRSFDPLSQVSRGEGIPSLSLHPVSEVMLNDDTIARFRERYRALFGAVTKSDPIYEAVSEGRGSAGMEHFLPLFYEQLDTLADYLPQAMLVYAHQTPQAMKEREELIHEYFDARKSAEQRHAAGTPAYHPLPPDRLYLSLKTWERKSEASRAVQFTPFVAETRSIDSVDAGYRGVRNLAGGRGASSAIMDDLRETLTSLRESGRRLFIAAYSAGSAARLHTMLAEHHLPVQLLEGWAERSRLAAGTVGLLTLPLEQGFEAPDFVLFSEQDVLGERILRPTRKKRLAENFLAEAANFTPGELVVHRDHGIARFNGLVTLEVQGSKHDCLALIYAEDAKLFLPVENIELIGRYGEGEEGVALDKLGGAAWQARKAKLKERIKVAAEALLKIAAERELHRISPMTPAPGLYEEFCARFPFAETDDQAKAIDEVLADFASGHPADRLICGDVGFGKTEVALRAAFVAATAPEGKKQVAIVAPTTLLARQHYLTFSERFAGFPVKVAALSRLVPSATAKAVKQQLPEGAVDIVIGTHALLAKDIRFADLGLVIVDEEQHFGVAQKEKLKNLRSDTHVLSLSATPIPRTLQMALSGIRELSLITTPPVDRLAVRTFVMPFDEVVIREALLREYHRGGKTFYVTPRIEYMATVQRRITELVPELKVAVAHGQMAPSQLDKIMNAFYEGKADVLISTAIIESGIDIPTANTLIVDHSELFGLAQLYQLRGRVGRSKTRAYAYFTLPFHKKLSDTATRRLEVMQTLDTLGAGFSLASHDMDIRGFGNLLGEEQSGHVREVGVELYQQMLEEAVLAVRGAAPKAAETFTPQISLPMSILIPETYIGDLSLRLGLYRRIAELSNEADLDSMAAELVDRFGPLPTEVEHLLAVVCIKLLCRKAGIEKVDVGPKGAVLTFYKNECKNPAGLVAFIAEHTLRAKLRADHKLVLLYEWGTDAEILKGVRHLLIELGDALTEKSVN